MTRALPYTKAVAQMLIAAARKQGLPVTGIAITTHPDGSRTLYTTVEEQNPAITLTLTPVPKLRDAREKFRCDG